MIRPRDSQSFLDALLRRALHRGTNMVSAPISQTVSALGPAAAATHCRLPQAVAIRSGEPASLKLQGYPAGGNGDREERCGTCGIHGVTVRLRTGRKAICSALRSHAGDNGVEARE